MVKCAHQDFATNCIIINYVIVACLFHYLYLPASTFCNVLGSSSAFAWIQISRLNNPSVTSLKIQASFSFFSGSHAMSSAKWSWYFTTILEYIKWFLVEKIRFFRKQKPLFTLFIVYFIWITYILRDVSGCQTLYKVW